MLEYLKRGETHGGAHAVYRESIAGQEAFLAPIHRTNMSMGVAPLISIDHAFIDGMFHEFLIIS